MSRYATHLLALTLSGAAVLAGVASCGGPGAGTAAFSDGTVSPKGDDDDDDQSSSTTSSSSSSGDSTTDKFFGKAPYDDTKIPPQNANDQTTGSHAGQVPLESKECVTSGCHLDVKPWAMAGTVYSAVDGTTPVAKVQVGIKTPDGKSVTATYTDRDGHFWLMGSAPEPGSTVAVRKDGASESQIMATKLPAAPQTGNCNSVVTGCHTTTLRIFVK